MAQTEARRLGKYQILGEIGQGGFATVYRAEDTTLGRTVALKVLDPLLLRDPAFVQRFRLEAGATANLYHPNIVALHEMGQAEGTFFLAVQYIDGPSLAECLGTEPLTLGEAARIVADVASALDHAHGQGLVHRDVKPSNILLDTNGRAYLSDFGIVKALEGTQVLTSRGGILGTPEYMSPEQAKSLPLDSRSDVYSLGVVAYQMCTGRVPFEGTTPSSVHYQHVHEPPLRPSTLHPQASGPVEEVLLQALAKSPEDRHPTAGAFAQALAAAVAQAGSRWVRQQVAEALAWIDAGRHQEAIERLGKLAQAHPGEAEIAAALDRAWQQAHLAEAYAELQRLWAQARAKAAEIRDAEPGYPDPDGLLVRLEAGRPRSRRVTAPRAEAGDGAAGDGAEDARPWLRWVPVCLIIVGNLVQAALFYAFWLGEI